MSEKKFDVISLGSCTMDLIFDVDDIMRMDLVDRDQKQKKYVCVENSSKLNVKSVKFFPGGSAANVVCNLANFELKTAYIGAIGSDSSGKTCMEDMENRNVDISGVKILDDDSTATSVILVNSFYKDRSILAYKGTNDLYRVDYIPEDMLKNTCCFLWTSLTSDSAIAAINKCIDIAKEYGALIGAAPSISIITSRRKETIEIVKKSDIISLNDEEILALTGAANVLEAMAELISWGLKRINCTLGKEGQWITNGKTLVKTQPPSIHVKDTTGAGDATMSGLIYGTLNDLSLKETARISVSLSAMEIEAVGVRIGLPKEKEALNKFMKSKNIQQEENEFPK